MGTKQWLIVLLALGLIATAGGRAVAQSAIRIGYVPGWPASSLVTKIAGRVIENRLERAVELVPVSAAPMYKRVASGNLDAHLSAWLPTTHHAYYGRLWPQLINLGPNLMGTRLGIAVPAYAEVDSIADLRSRVDAFDYKIIGVDLGAGVNINTKKAIAAYDLGMHLVPSSTAAMGAALAQATAQHELIAVTAWKPLWIWQRFDLKMLADPKRVYGTGDHVSTVVSPALWQKAPRVFKCLDRMMFTMAAINAMESKLRSGHSEAEVVAAFIRGHQDKVAMWTYGLTP